MEYFQNLHETLDKLGVNNMIDKAKNTVLNFTPTEIKVREATSLEAWGPSGTQMSDIAQLSYRYTDCNEIMATVWSRLEEKHWRHVYKTLLLLDYCLKNGSERVIEKSRQNLYILRSLEGFRYMEEGKDQGNNVRLKARDIVNLLEDDERLWDERDKARKNRGKYVGTSSGSSGFRTMDTGRYGGFGNPNYEDQSNRFSYRDNGNDYQYNSRNTSAYDRDSSPPHSSRQTYREGREQTQNDSYDRPHRSGRTVADGSDMDDVRRTTKGTHSRRGRSARSKPIASRVRESDTEPETGLRGRRDRQAGTVREVSPKASYDIRGVRPERGGRDGRESGGDRDQPVRAKAMPKASRGNARDSWRDDSGEKDERDYYNDNDDDNVDTLARKVEAVVLDTHDDFGEFTAFDGQAAKQDEPEDGEFGDFASFSISGPQTAPQPAETFGYQAMTEPSNMASQKQPISQGTADLLGGTDQSASLMPDLMSIDAKPHQQAAPQNFLGGFEQLNATPVSNQPMTSLSDMPPMASTAPLVGPPLLPSTAPGMASTQTQAKSATTAKGGNASAQPSGTRSVPTGPISNTWGVAANLVKLDAESLSKAPQSQQKDAHAQPMAQVFMQQNPVMGGGMMAGAYGMYPRPTGPVQGQLPMFMAPQPFIRPQQMQQNTSTGASRQGQPFM